MPPSNVEVVRQANEAFNRGDVDSWLELFDPDVVYYDESNLDTPAVIHGREQLRAAVESIAAELDGFRGDVELIDAGKSVLSITTWRGIGQASGAPVELHEFIVFVIVDGKIVEGRAFASRQNALQAAGLLS